MSPLEFFNTITEHLPGCEILECTVKAYGGSAVVVLGGQQLRLYTFQEGDHDSAWKWADTPPERYRSDDKAHGSLKELVAEIVGRVQKRLADSRESLERAEREWEAVRRYSEEVGEA